MFEVQARYPKGSREYQILDYRIKCGQLYQQNTIDKSKGIEAKDMPDKWYGQNTGKISKENTSGENKVIWLNYRTAVDKKPYFMKYIYPGEHEKFNKYLKAANEKCLMIFRMSLNELLNKENKTDEEESFIRSYRHKLPLGTAPCTVNRICRKIESIFDNVKQSRNKNFDYSILKCDVEYSKPLFNKIKKIYDIYQNETSEYMQYAKSERIKSDELQMQKYLFNEDFKRKCLELCPNEECLCNIILDLCYSKSKSSKQFAWDICGDIFIRNLLKRNNYTITYPTLDENGEIEFNGQRFTMKTTKIKEFD